MISSRTKQAEKAFNTVSIWFSLLCLGAVFHSQCRDRSTNRTPNVCTSGVLLCVSRHWGGSLLPAVLLRASSASPGAATAAAGRTSLSVPLGPGRALFLLSGSGRPGRAGRTVLRRTLLLGPLSAIGSALVLGPSASAAAVTAAAALALLIGRGRLRLSGVIVPLQRSQSRRQAVLRGQGSRFLLFAQLRQLGQGGST